MLAGVAVMIMLIPFNAVIAMKTRAYQVCIVKLGRGNDLICYFQWNHINNISMFVFLCIFLKLIIPSKY